MKRALFAAVLAVAVLQFMPTQAAGSYDGTWNGAVEGASGRCPPGTIVMHISGGRILGHLALGAGVVPFRGTVAADGGVNAGYNYPQHSAKGTLTGTITGDDFAGKLDSSYAATNSSCVRNVSAKRS